MKPRSLGILLGMLLLVVLTACADESGDQAEETDSDSEAEETEEASEEAALDCDPIEVMVPYAPGGGSDRQVRRLEPQLTEILDTDLNVVYREGAAGATAWAELQQATPDGCTVANVVVPNILISAEVDDAPFDADEFEYLGFTESSPNVIAVHRDSEFEDIEGFLEAAREDPGGITIAGSGQGPRATEQFEEAADIDVTFIPQEGGASDGLTAIETGDADAVNFAASHAVRYEDSVRPLVLSGPERSPALEGVPTMEELGHEGFDIVARWGLIAPPGTPDDVVEAWNEALNEANQSDEVQQALIDGGLTPLETTAEEAEEWLAEQLEEFDPAEFE